MAEVDLAARGGGGGGGEVKRKIRRLKINMATTHCQSEVIQSFKLSQSPFQLRVHRKGCLTLHTHHSKFLPTHTNF